MVKHWRNDYNKKIRKRKRLREVEIRVALERQIGKKRETQGKWGHSPSANKLKHKLTTL